MSRPAVNRSLTFAFRLSRRCRCWRELGRSRLPISVVNVIDDRRGCRMKVFSRGWVDEVRVPRSRQRTKTRRREVEGRIVEPLTRRAVERDQRCAAGRALTGLGSTALMIGRGVMPVASQSSDSESANDGHIACSTSDPARRTVGNAKFCSVGTRCLSMGARVVAEAHHLLAALPFPIIPPVRCGLESKVGDFSVSTVWCRAC